MYFYGIKLKLFWFKNEFLPSSTKFTEEKTNVLMCHLNVHRIK